MSEGLNYSINFTGNAVQILQHVNEILGNTQATAKKATGVFGDCWKALLASNQVVQSLSTLKSSLAEVNAPGIALNKNMQDLSAITGITGKGLDSISDAARESAKAFGTNAAENVESYKIILSKLSPDIAKSTEAMKAMGDNVNILSKSMGGDTVASAGVLTTAMNQYSVSTKDPIQASKDMAEMMNIMAAGAQMGSAELPEIGKALENVGMLAKTTGVSFAETNAAIQVLDKAGAKGAEGGVALRNILAAITAPSSAATDALNSYGISTKKLADPTISLSEKMKMLKPVMGDVTAVSKIFEKANIGAAIAMIKNTDALDEYTVGIQGTTSAQDQAKIVMESYEERMKRQKAKLDDMKIGFFNATESIQPYLSITMEATESIGKMGAGVTALSSLFNNDFTKGILNAITGIFKKTAATTADTVATGANTTAKGGNTIATQVATVAQRVFNTVMTANPLGAFLRGLLLVGTALAAGAALLSAYNTHQNRTAELTQDVAAKISVEQAGLNDLFEQIKRTNPLSEHRNELIAQLNQRYPDLLKNQHLETMNEAELETARRGANDELERTITLQAVKEGKEKALKDKSETDLDLTKGLFKYGGNDADIAEFRNQVNSKSADIVASGKYQSGWLSGADNDQISGIINSIRSANPALIKRLGIDNNWDALGSKVRDFVDASLSSSNDVQILDKVAGTVKTKIPTTAPVKEEPKPDDDKPPVVLGAEGIKAAKDAKKLAEKEKKEKENAGGGVSSRGSYAGSNGGGGGSKTIGSLTINKLVETLVIHTTNLGDTKEKIKQAVTETLLTSVADFNLSNS